MKQSKAPSIHLLVGKGEKSACDLPVEESWLKLGTCTAFVENCTCSKCIIMNTSDEAILKLYKAVIGEEE